MKIALAQIDTEVGAVRHNEARIAAAIREAAGGGAELVVFPELAITGYPPKDLLCQEELVRETLRATARLAEVAPAVTVIVGTLARALGPGGKLTNAAAVLEGGQVRTTRGKSLLPADDVFDEPRWFQPAEPASPVQIGGRRVGILICEDLWDEAYERSPATELRAAGADLLVCINASPFRRGVLKERLRRARRAGLPLVYVNAVGAQDDLIFDGSSFALSGDGRVQAALPACAEAVRVVDLACDGPVEEPREASVREALLLGLRDFVKKNRLPRVVIGLSGGIDSALVLCLAAEALGPERVHAVHIPSRFTSRRSTDDARTLCANLGLSLSVVDLEPLHAAAEQSLQPLGFSGGVAENAQARLRGMLLMAWVNRLGGALLNTSNKTELALGYGTLYGDLNGALGVIADLTKPEVYALAREAYLGVIPDSTLERPPSAELAADQVDPFDYPHLAPLVELLVAGASEAELRNAGATAEEIAWIERRVRGAEFKRFQAPPGLKVSWKAFGPGRRVPLTRGTWFEPAPLERRARSPREASSAA